MFVYYISIYLLNIYSSYYKYHIICCILNHYIKCSTFVQFYTHNYCNTAQYWIESGGVRNDGIDLYFFKYFISWTAILSISYIILYSEFHIIATFTVFALYGNIGIWKNNTLMYLFKTTYFVCIALVNVKISLNL